MLHFLQILNPTIHWIYQVMSNDMPRQRPFLVVHYRVKPGKHVYRFVTGQYERDAAITALKRARKRKGRSWTPIEVVDVKPHRSDNGRTS